MVIEHGALRRIDAHAPAAKLSLRRQLPHIKISRKFEMTKPECHAGIMQWLC
jgi:hypothetical protein